MEKSIRVSIMGREYALRVDEQSEALTREIATSVDEKMQAFRRAHPDQAKLTAAVVVALALAEQVHDAQRHHADHTRTLDDALGALADRLAAALPPETNGAGVYDDEETNKE